MSLLRNNKPFFVFLAKFVATYLILSFIYSFYLDRYDKDKFETDGITKMVAEQSKDLLLFFGKEAYTMPHESQASVKFYVKNRLVSRIVEGCNAVSVMILFTAFIIAFSGSFKKTSLYIGAGIIIIYVLNIVRIALLCLGFYYYPQYNTLTHDIIFPLFIYGVVFLLWVLWVQKFSGYAKKRARK